MREDLREKDKLLEEKNVSIDRLQNEFSQESSRAEKYRKDLKEIRTDIEGMKHELLSAEERARDKEKELDLLDRLSKKEKRQHKEDLEEIIQNKEKEITELKEEISSYKTMLEEKNREATQLEMDLVQTNQILTEKSSLVAELKRDKVVLTTDNYILRASMDVLMRLQFMSTARSQVRYFYACK